MSKVKTPGIKKRNRRQDWWKGGTLHEANLAEWAASTIDNHLATMADFVYALKTHPEQYNPDISYQNPNELLAKYCVPLMVAVNEVAKTRSDIYYHKVSTTVLLLAHQLGFIKRNVVQEEIDQVKMHRLQEVINETASEA